MASWLPIVDGALSLTEEIFKYINTKESRKYLDKSVKIKKEILKEKNKGYYSDDTRVAVLISELNIIMEAARREFSLAMKQGNEQE